MEIDKLLRSLFNDANRNQAFGLLNTHQNELELIRPYGLSYGDLYHILDASCTFSFVDQVVLEFGGCLPKEFIFRFLKPRSWHSITLDLYDNSYIHDPNHLYRQGANIKSDSNYISSNLGIQYFYQLLQSGYSSPGYTRVFSVAAFEHLSQPYLSLAQLMQLLSPDAVLYAFFSPVWSAPNGHHWSDFPHKLPAYIHLCHTYSSFMDFCVTHYNMSLLEAEKHAYFIYKSPRINRLVPSEWARLFSSNLLSNAHVQAIHPRNIADIAEIPCELKNSIKEHLQSEFLCEGYRVVSSCGNFSVNDMTIN